MLDKLNQLWPPGKALLATAIVAVAPLCGWLGYRFGVFLGGH